MNANLFETKQKVIFMFEYRNVLLVRLFISYQRRVFGSAWNTTLFGSFGFKFIRCNSGKNSPNRFARQLIAPIVAPTTVSKSPFQLRNPKSYQFVPHNQHDLNNFFFALSFSLSFFLLLFLFRTSSGEENSFLDIFLACHVTHVFYMNIMVSMNPRLLRPLFSFRSIF